MIGGDIYGSPVRASVVLHVKHSDSLVYHISRRSRLCNSMHASRSTVSDFTPGIEVASSGA